MNDRGLFRREQIGAALALLVWIGAGGAALATCSPPAVSPTPAGAQSRKAGTRGGWLGAWLSDALDGGVQVIALVPGGPARRAGVQPGDIIVGANGIPVADQRALSRLLTDSAPGDSLSFSLVRSGESLQVPVRLGRRPEEPIAPVPVPPGLRSLEETTAEARRLVESMERPERLFGLEVAEITPALREHFGAPADAGVLVVRIDPARIGGAANLEIGDVLVRLGGHEIRDRGGVERALGAWSWNGPLQAEVVRDGETRAVSWNRRAPEDALLASPAPASSPAHDAEGERAVLERKLELQIERLQRRVEELQRQLEELRKDR